MSVQPKNPEIPRTWPYLVVGLLFVVAAIIFGQTFEVGPKAMLDLQGQRAAGTAEATGETEDGETIYTLRYTHPDGTIYRQPRYTGGFAYQSAEGDVEITYDPDNPGNFQPVGLSYMPGVVTLGLFATGFVVILRARQRLRQHIRAERRANEEA